MKVGKPSDKASASLELFLRRGCTIKIADETHAERHTIHAGAVCSILVEWPAGEDYVAFAQLFNDGVVSDVIPPTHLNVMISNRKKLSICAVRRGAVVNKDVGPKQG
jgi:hypothetical protein